MFRLACNNRLVLLTPNGSLGSEPTTFHQERERRIYLDGCLLEVNVMKG